MRVRAPNWDFTGLKAHWAPNAEFAQIHNAASTVPAYIEPYLLKVMRRAREKLGPEHAVLREKLDIFIRQEMAHFRQHLAFNDAIHADGYESMLAIEKAYEADYVRFLKTRSLRWNCAYSEGFEAMSAVAVTNFFEEFDEFFEGADPRAVEMWKWHLAEEYEHREVAHDVFQALFGRNPVTGYLWRIYGFIYAVRHIRAHGQRLSRHLIALDRASMTPAEIEASRARVAHVNAVSGRRARAHLKAILSPWYKPKNRPVPRGVEQLLAQIEAGQIASAA